MALPRQLYNRDNIQRAWRWVRSNPDRSYKSYFRELYAAYTIAEDQLLARLQDRLRRGIYEPEPACKIYLPKKSGILRPYSLLAIEDQIAYQAAANLIAEALFPRVRARYLNEVFGHLYAGKASLWFYRKWSDGYRAFNDVASAAFRSGHRFTASFDLTACYDSIDHKVLHHFLMDLKLTREFSDVLIDWLSRWTATDRNIFHGHGIPQGPLPSGLMSEVVLRHFDEHQWAKMGLRYLRYVDDIRLFAKTEKILRQVLVRLDRLSKDIGLFPQSSKIDIHEVTDITKELKSVSQPPEATVRAKIVDQGKLRSRLTALSYRYSIEQPTRFKYLLAHAQPCATLTARLWKIYERAPDYYEPIARYLSRYKSFPHKTAVRLFQAVADGMLYQSMPATFLGVAKGRLRSGDLALVRRRAKPLWKPRVTQADFSASLGRLLIATRNLTDRQLEYAIRYTRPGWFRASLLLELSPAVVPASLMMRLVSFGVRDGSLDAALAAAYVAGLNGIRPASPIRGLNDGAKLVLKEFGIIRRAAVTTCGVAISLDKLLKWSPPVDWRVFFGPIYGDAERQLIECRGLAAVNATAWVNALDVFNDYLLSALFRKDGTLGGYTLGKPGSILNSSGSRLEAKYADVFRYAKAIHDKRAESLLSHPRVRATGRATGRIPFSYIGQSKGLLRKAIREIGAAGLA